jgi:mannose-1-phosphate guanylyltransferase/mannose-6-phosphate isomerase
MTASRQLVPLIICGGAGTRFWPASREFAPKQFIKLRGAHSSFQEMLTCVGDLELFSKPVIVTNEEYHHVATERIEAMGMTATILLEPRLKDPGPAIVVGASYVAKRYLGGIVMVLAADRVVQDQAKFEAAVEKAAFAAEAGAIVTFDITLDHPATGRAYLRCGAERGHRENREGRLW